MRRAFLILLIISITLPVFAYKAYWYDENGNRVYKTISQEEISKNKNRPRRAYVRQPRKNWEISPEMRARKRTYNYKGKN